MHRVEEHPLRTTVILALLAAALLAAGSLWPSPSLSVRPAGAQAAPARPNIVVIMTDDQTVRQLAVMANTRSLIEAQGTSFVNAYAATPECCPSRATFLTGQYQHNHGVLSSALPTGGYTKLDHTNTLAVWLQQSGYFTALAGKYLNGYGSESPQTPPPGWSDWWGLVDPTTIAYWGYTINQNGTPRTYGRTDADYQTDVLGAHVEDLIRQRAGQPDPFFIWWTPLAPHFGLKYPGASGAYPLPAARHYRTLIDQPIRRTPDFNEADVSDKPPHVQWPLMTAEQAAGQDSFFRMANETLLAVDEWVGNIVRALDETGQLDNTIIVFASDNGFFYGEHRFKIIKAKPYEMAVRVPLIIRGPGFAPGVVNKDLVSLVDLAPTITDLAGATPGRTMDGWSLVPGRQTAEQIKQRALLMEYGPLDNRPTYKTVRDTRWKYIEWSTGHRELYDLWNDPWELQNRAGNPDYRLAEWLMRRRWLSLASCVGAACQAGPPAF